MPVPVAIGPQAKPRHTCAPCYVSTLGAGTGQHSGPRCVLSTTRGGFVPSGPTRRPDTFAESGYFTDDRDGDELDHLWTVEQPCASFVTLRWALNGIVNRPLSRAVL